jgi:hypothetical protein
MTIYGSYPGSGNSVCCPAGMEQRGDGSACQGGGQTACKLFSNPNLPLCSSVSAHGTQLVECAAGSCFTAVTATDKKQDNTCTSCGDNEYKEGLNAETSCTQYTALKCGAGEYFNATDKTQDNTCFACGDNTYKEGLNDETSCTPKTLECACVCVCVLDHAQTTMTTTKTTTTATITTTTTTLTITTTTTAKLTSSCFLTFMPPPPPQARVRAPTYTHTHAHTNAHTRTY